jgi:hypothetical protein
MLHGTTVKITKSNNRTAKHWVHYTTSCITQPSVPEDGQNGCPKHVELIGVINKLLLLHLVGYVLLLLLSRIYVHTNVNKAYTQSNTFFGRNI